MSRLKSIQLCSCPSYQIFPVFLLTVFPTYTILMDLILIQAKTANVFHINFNCNTLLMYMYMHR